MSWWHEAKHFSSNEFDSPDMIGSGWLMDREFIFKLDRAREEAGVPFLINSGYRTQEHNRKVGGVPDSAHLKGYAADISVTNKTRGIILKALYSVGFTRFGIGRNYIHVDDDPSKPSNRVWHYYSVNTLTKIFGSPTLDI